MSVRYVTYAVRNLSDPCRTSTPPLCETMVWAQNGTEALLLSTCDAGDVRAMQILVAVLASTAIFLVLATACCVHRHSQPVEPPKTPA